MGKGFDVMVDEFSTPVDSFISEDSPILEAVSLVRDKGIRHLPVLRDNKPVGILSDRDLNLLGTMNDLSGVKVGDFMVKDPFCVRLGTPIDEVAFAMSERKIGSALILNESGELDSIFTSTDALNALIEIARGDI